MSEEKYMPTIGDVVDGDGYHSGAAGIYIGQQSGRGDDRHVILGEDSKNCTIVGRVSVPYRMTLGSGSRSYASYGSAEDLAERGARLLAEICEGLEAEQTAKQQQQSPGYRSAAGSAFDMTKEMALWWQASRARMAKVCFIEAAHAIKDAREKIAAIERLGGSAPVEMQERLEAAHDELSVRRARVLSVFAEQIAEAQKQYKVEDVP